MMARGHAPPPPRSIAPPRPAPAPAFPETARQWRRLVAAWRGLADVPFLIVTPRLVLRFLAWWGLTWFAVGFLFGSPL